MIILERILNNLQDNDLKLVQDFFDDSVLIPVPRSSLIHEGDLWPSLEICKTLLNRGFGNSIVPILKRSHAIPKSSLHMKADDRPSVATQKESLKVDSQIISPTKAILVDDVITLGRTTFACAAKIFEYTPNCQIKVAAVMRTKGFEPISKFITPSLGFLSYNPYSGKVSRRDK